MSGIGFIWGRLISVHYGRQISSDKTGFFCNFLFERRIKRKLHTDIS